MNPIIAVHSAVRTLIVMATKSCHTPIWEKWKLEISTALMEIVDFNFTEMFFDVLLIS